MVGTNDVVSFDAIVGSKDDTLEATGGEDMIGGRLTSPDGEGNDDASAGAEVTGTETLGVDSIDEATVGALVASMGGSEGTPELIGLPPWLEGPIVVSTGLALGKYEG
jgi:hypothetical protein